MRLLKSIYFFTICFPPLLLSLFIAPLFGGDETVPQSTYVLLVLMLIYFAIGCLIVLADVWIIRVSLAVKVTWTILILVFWIYVLPVYYVLRLTIYKDGKGVFGRRLKQHS